MSSNVKSGEGRFFEKKCFFMGGGRGRFCGPNVLNGVANILVMF